MAGPSTNPQISVKRTLESDPPRFTSGAAERIALRSFGIKAQAASLDSERDQNFRLHTADGTQYVLKIANAEEDPAAIDFENAVLEHIHTVAPTIPIPRIVASTANENVVIHPFKGVNYLVRCLTWLSGECVDDVASTFDLRKQMGVELATLGRALRGLFHPAARKPLLWDIQNLAELTPWIADIEDASTRAFCTTFVTRFAENTLPKLAGLRCQVIYNDMHGGNVYVNNDAPRRISGIGDFGDTLYGPLICDVAVAAAYQLSMGDDPLNDVIEFVQAYNSITALEREEIDLLPELITARLVTMLAIAAWRVRRYPENRDYILGDTGAATRGLEVLSAAPTHKFARRLREACGLDDSPDDSANQQSDEELRNRRELVFGSTFELFYDRPVNLVRGDGVWLYDQAGEAYLDAYNNVPLVGHCHPAVVSALSHQAATLNTHTRYLNNAVVEYADRLLALFCADLDRVMFSCTGSEANELAVRVARAYTGNAGIIVTRCAYHGNTTTIAELSPGDSGKETFEKWVETIPSPDTYRRTARKNSSEWVQDYLDEVDLALERMRGRGVKPAALLLDCAFTSDGMFLPPQGLVTGATARIRAAGGVLIADEVQSGFGRMGQAMWGFEVHGAEPEIVTLGKPIGNGHPLAATIMRHELLDAFTQHDHYFNTFGGNPVSAKVGLAVLDAFERDGLLRNSRETGLYLKDCLEGLAESYECIGDVRSFGLIAGVELVSDRAAKTPAADMARRIVNNMRELRILISREGLHGNVLKIRPPLPFGPANVDQLVDGLKQSVRICL